MTHEQLKAKALKKLAVKTEYEALEDEFLVLKAVLLARQQSGLSQEDMAKKMGVSTTTIMQLEDALLSGRHLPAIAKLKQYAELLNCHVEIKLVPNN